MFGNVGTKTIKPDGHFDLRYWEFGNLRIWPNHRYSLQPQWVIDSTPKGGVCEREREREREEGKKGGALKRLTLFLTHADAGVEHILTAFPDRFFLPGGGTSWKIGLLNFFFGRYRFCFICFPFGGKTGVLHMPVILTLPWTQSLPYTVL